MNYKSTISIESQACPGVTFTIKKMNKYRRDKLEEANASVEAKVAEIEKEFAPLNTELIEALKVSRAVNKTERAAAIAEGRTEAQALATHPYGVLNFADERFQRWHQLNESMRRIDRQELSPSNLNFCVISIEGLEIDGQPATIALLREAGADDLWAEIELAVARELGLLPEEKANLPSPSTSAVAVDGNLTPGTAPSVERLVTITPSVDAANSTAPANAPATTTALTP